MAESSAKLAPKPSFLNPAVQARIAQSQTTAAKANETAKVNPFANIKENPFHKIAFSKELSAQEKAAALSKELAKNEAGTEEAREEKVKELEELKSYLTSVQKQMARDVISLSNKKTFNTLQQCIGGLNNDLLNFDKEMEPLTDLLEAVYALRTAGEGVTYSVFEEIAKDKEYEADYTKRYNIISEQVKTLSTQVATARDDIEELGTQTNWFGSIKASAKVAIANKTSFIESTLPELDDLKKQLVALQTEKNQRESVSGNYAAEKAKLRQMLDLSDEAQTQRVENLCNSALAFIDNGDEKVGMVLGELNQYEEQVKKQLKNNNLLTGVFAILNKGVKGAVDLVNDERKALTEVKPDEDELDKLERDQKRMGVDRFIARLIDTSTTTASLSLDLQKDAVDINTAGSNAAAQISMVKDLHTRGMSSMAKQLSMVVTSVGNAASTESAEGIRATVNLMNKKTTEIAQKEVIRFATGVDQVNETIVASMEQLAGLSEALDAAKKIRSQGMANITESIRKAQEMADQVDHLMQENIEISAKTDGSQVEVAPVAVTTALDDFK